MTIADDVSKLNERIIDLPPKDRTFAVSLVNQWKTKHRLSQEQQLWVDRLTQRAIDAKAAAAQPKTPVVPDATIQLSALQDLFNRAKANGIVTPRVRVQMKDGQRMRVAAAPATGKNPGSLYINIGETYYGLVTREGYLMRPSYVRRCEEVEELLTELAANPSAFGKVHGQRTKWCCFCGLELTQQDSLFYGYGPICAEKWNLEWGESGTRKIEQMIGQALPPDFLSGFNFDKEKDNGN